MTDSDALEFFVYKALSKGKTREEVLKALVDAGWAEQDVVAELNNYADIDFPVPVPKPRPSSAARDYFTYFVLFGTLYVVAVGIGQMLYSFINLAFPLPSDYGTQDSRIRWAIAELVIALPIFILMARANAKQLKKFPAMRISRPRRLLTYLTLVIAAAILIGDAITLIYRLLDGDLTVRFLLKVLVLAAIAGSTFLFYLRDLKRDEKVELQV